MIYTKQLAEDIWSIDNLDSKKELVHRLIDAMNVKDEIKNRFRNNVDGCKSMSKIDKLTTDLILVEYDIKDI